MGLPQNYPRGPINGKHYRKWFQDFKIYKNLSYK
jgi:hypothetical protein